MCCLQKLYKNLSSLQACNVLFKAQVFKKEKILSKTYSWNRGAFQYDQLMDANKMFN